MRLPIKVHAVKIRYRERVLQSMVHGRFGNCQGKRCVYVTYDPKEKGASRHVQKRYSLNSEMGKKYTPQVERYLKVKAEFDALLVDWRATYVFEPPEVRFPILQTYDPHHMDTTFFDTAESGTNKLKAEHPVYSGGDVLKSKNEQFGKRIFQQFGIPYKYETALTVNNPSGYVPDYLLSLYEIDRCIYAEICGMSDDYEYSAGTAKKINFYSINRYRPGREIIYVFMYDKYNFDEEYCISQILGAFETLIPEDALDWKNCHAPRVVKD